MFTEEASPLSQTRTPCFLSHIAKIFTLIGSLGPPRFIFLGGIPLMFFWLCECSFRWNFCPQLNRQVNAFQFKP